VGRVADGVPNRTHRLKGLGNAVVPGVVSEIGRVIMHFHENGIDPRG
jgi:site-specific DNA-cytosine methylase